MHVCSNRVFLFVKMFSFCYFYSFAVLYLLEAGWRSLTPDLIRFSNSEHCLAVFISTATWLVLSLCTPPPTTSTSFINQDKTCRSSLSYMDLNTVLAGDFPHQNNEAFNIIFLILLLLSWFKNKNACFQMSCSTVPRNTWEYFVVADWVGWRKIETYGHGLTLSVPGLGFSVDPGHEIFVSQFCIPRPITSILCVVMFYCILPGVGQHLVLVEH